MSTIKIIVLAIIFIALYILHKFLIWCESKEWIYYRKGFGMGAMGNALMELQSFLEPSVKNVIEVKRHENLEEEESGDPPDPTTEDHLEPE
jgi:hypothetical protein